MSEARKILNRVANRLYGPIGCHDGSCVFGHPGGMTTNGGCQCLKEQNIHMLRRVILQLSSVAVTLAAVSPEDTPSRDKKGGG